jgi:predicted nucleotidyltransferase
MILQRWEQEWKEEKNARVAAIYNQIVKIMAREKAHIDEMIIALEIALHEALDAKMNMIRQQRETPSELSSNTPTEVKG